MPQSHEVLALVAEQSRDRVVVFDKCLRIVYQNARARTFLERNAMPGEIGALARRIHEEIARGGDLGAVFPGRITLAREIGLQRWVFRVAYARVPEPLVCVYFWDESVSGHFDLNGLRQQYSLTRREVDVLRHLLDGSGNREISEELGVAEQTVKDHVSSIYGKIGVRDRFSLLRQFVGAAPTGGAPLPGSPTPPPGLRPGRSAAPPPAAARGGRA